jgi:hypothetical protein
MKKYQSFKEFYPYYLSEHSNVTCRRLHFIGTTLVILFAVSAIINQSWTLVILLPLFGYGFAWVGHFFFEKNRPATFTYPLWSLMGDFVMYKDMLTGKVSWR